MPQLTVALTDTEVTDGNPSSENQTSTKAFTPFRKLPVEIRRAIWAASLPAPRVFEPNYHENGLHHYQVGRPTRFIQEWAPTRMRGACREAYAVCMSSSRFTFGWFKNSGICGLWFNDKHDAVYFSKYEQWDTARVCGVQTVYVSTEIALGDLLTREGFEHDNLAACRRRVVALRPKMLYMTEDVTLDDVPGMKPIFRAMSDNDIIGWHDIDAARFPEIAGNEYLTWGDLKSAIQETRQKLIAKNAENPNFYKGPIQMEAVEVFRAPDDREGLI